MKIKSKKWVKRENKRKWRLAVNERDEYCCQICKKKLSGINCQTHHIIPKQFAEFEYDVKNGITLCYRCHKVGKYSAHLNAMFFVLFLQRNKSEQYKYLFEKIW